MRADARRNRALIVDAAAGLFAARGPEVSMEEIAQAAGLGVGTLYRHFPDRRALLEEIAAGALRTLLDVARDHAARPVSRWDALLACVRRGADLPLALTKSLSDGAEAHPELGPLVRDLDAVLEDLAGEPSGKVPSATTSHRARSSGCSASPCAAPVPGPTTRSPSSSSTDSVRGWPRARSGPDHNATDATDAADAAGGAGACGRLAAVAGGLRRLRKACGKGCAGGRAYH